MKTTIDHIGIKVLNIEKTSKAFETMGIKLDPTKIRKNKMGLRTVFLACNGCKIELLEIADANKKNRNNNKNKLGIHHIAFRVQNIRNAYNKLKNNKACKVLLESTEFSRLI